MPRSNPSQNTVMQPLVVCGRTIRRVETYERFQRFIRSWANGSIPHAGTIGPPGTGKTSEYEAILNETPHHLFRGRTSALVMYTTVKDAPGWPIIFDDIGGLLKDGPSIDFMKQIADSRPFRTIRWRTNALPESERSFVCTSPVLVVLNQVPNDPDVHAVLDRLDVIEFAPTKSEIIAKMRSFARSQKDVDIIAEAAVIPSLRTLKHFEGWKKSELDEIEELYSECGVPASVQHIADIMERFPKQQWVKQYQAMTGKGREAAKREWSRKRHLAAQLLEARRKSSDPCPIVPESA